MLHSLRSAYVDPLPKSKKKKLEEREKRKVVEEIQMSDTEIFQGYVSGHKQLA